MKRPARDSAALRRLTDRPTEHKLDWRLALLALVALPFYGAAYAWNSWASRSHARGRRLTG
ncbi:hypothetical protein ACQP1W_16710 [Spirillospora sp. CA-255316]